MPGTPAVRLRIFPVTPRNRNPSNYVDEVMRVAAFGDSCCLSGVLLFTGNDTPIEPWPMAQYLLEHTAKISPLIAVNPVYMHPFTVARLISSLTRLYGRRIYLNMVAGTAISDLTGIGGAASHSKRYDRLREFIDIVRRLVSSPKPLKYDGTFYQVLDLQLRDRIPTTLLPEFFVAGQSEEALRLCRESDCLAMQMLPPDLDVGLVGSLGVNLGILTRKDRNEAWAAALAKFSDSEENKLILQHTMQNTDAIWKHKLYIASRDRILHDNGYWLGPFANFQADCAYLVGSYMEVAETLERISAKGVSTIILDLLAEQEEFEHVANTLRLIGTI